MSCVKMEVEDEHKKMLRKAIEKPHPEIDEKALRSCHENLMKMKKVIAAAEPHPEAKIVEPSTSEKLKTIESRYAFLYSLFHFPFSPFFLLIF